MAAKNIIPIKEAVDTAVKYINNLYDEEQLRNLMLEEVELSEDETHWLITLGFDRRRPVRNTFEALQSMTPYERAYKTIEIRADTGEVRSMKIRELPATAELK